MTEAATTTSTRPTPVARPGATRSVGRARRASGTPATTAVGRASQAAQPCTSRTTVPKVMSFESGPLTSGHDAAESGR